MPARGGTDARGSSTRGALALLGAAVGYLACWWGLFARPASPLHASRASTLVAGGLALALAYAAARAGASALLWADARRPARADDRFELLCVDDDGAAATAATGAAAPQRAVPLASCGARPDVRSLLERYGLGEGGCQASRGGGGTDYESVDAEQSTARSVAAGGPPGLLAEVDAALAQAGRPAAVRLTFTM